MFICVTATGGGAGATVTAASAALTAPHGATLVDLDGDLGAALGVRHDGLGIRDWLASDAPADRLDELVVPAGRTDVGLLPWAADRVDRRSAAHVPTVEPDRWTGVIEWCRARAADRRAIVVDAGRHLPTATVIGHPATELVVTRACYLALRRWVGHHPPSGVVVVREAGRSITDADIARTLAAPVLASTPWDPAVARAVDAGLLTQRLPVTLRRLGRAVHTAAPRSERAEDAA